MSALDAEFLHLEEDRTPYQIAGVSVFEGPSPGLAALKGLLAGKLPLLPRYRQRVRTVPLELGRPVWVDDPDFDLDHHVSALDLPPPGDDHALAELVAARLSERLDRDRPLWRAGLVEGLPGGRWAVLSEVHHCMVDGVAGMGLLAALLDLEADTPVPEPAPWEPEPEPSGARRVLDAWWGLAADTGRLLGQVPGALARPGDTARTVLGAGAGLVTFASHLGRTPELSIEGAVGAGRVWAPVTVELDDVRTVRGTFDGTVNDVVLTLVAGGHRALLRSRGEDPDTAVLRTGVPVSTRTGSGASDNEVSAMLYELPVAVADPVERLRTVHEDMTALKGSHMAEAGEVVTTLGLLAPPMVVGPASRLAAHLNERVPQRSVNTVTTNVPGPQVPLYCLGRRMVEQLPYVPITHGVRVGVAIVSYDGRLSFGVTGDRDTAADVGVLAAAVRDELAALVRRAEAATSADAGVAEER